MCPSQSDAPFPMISNLFFLSQAFLSDLTLESLYLLLFSSYPFHLSIFVACLLAAASCRFLQVTWLFYLLVLLFSGWRLFKILRFSSFLGCGRISGRSSAQNSLKTHLSSLKFFTFCSIEAISPDIDLFGLPPANAISFFNSPKSFSSFLKFTA